MKNSNLIKVLKTFSKDEMKEFERFVDSPFFSKGRNLLPLFRELKKTYPTFDESKLDPSKIFKRLYPGKKFSESTMKKLTTSLYELSVDYLKQISLREFPVYSNHAASFILTKRNLDTLALKYIKQNDVDSGKSKIGIRYFTSRSSFYEAMNFFYYNKRDLTNYKDVFTYRKKTLDNMVISFLYNFHMAAADLVTLRKRFESLNINLQLLEVLNSFDFQSLLEKIETSPESKSDRILLLSLYFLISMKNPTEREYLEKYSELFYESSEYFDDLFAIDMYGAFKKLLDYKSNFLEKELISVMKFRFFNQMLEKDLYIDKFLNYFPKNNFKIIFLHAYEMGKLEWAENFIEKYSQYLKEDEKEYTVAICRSYLHFARNNFGKCLDELNQIDIRYPTEKLAYYNLRAAALFELKYFEETDSVLIAYKKFVERDSVTFTNSAEHLNFIKSMKHLINYQLTRDDSHLFSLKKIISPNTSKIVLKKWLLKKAEL